MRYILGLLLVSSLLLGNVESSSPKCSDCAVFATGKDGTLWGWENDSFCRISSSCSSSTKSTKSSTTRTTKKVTKTTTIKKSSNHTSSTKKSTSSTKKSSHSTTTTKKSSSSSSTTTTKKSSSDSSSSDTSKATSTSAVSASTSTSSTSATHSVDAKGNVICNGCVVTATGGDKSLWGWEDEKSCVIDEAKCKGKLEDETKPANGNAEANHKKDAAGNYICNECTVTATGSDNSYWGWEDEASCIIDNTKCNLTPPEPQKTTTPLQRGPDGILICSTCEYTRIDPDTTTWNKENGEDCRVIGSRCGINTTPHPWCSGCVVTGTGNDGALYGWENTASCLINEITCGLIDNSGSTYTKVEAESGALPEKYVGFYYVVATLVTLLIVRGF